MCRLPVVSAQQKNYHELTSFCRQHSFKLSVNKKKDEIILNKGQYQIHFLINSNLVLVYNVNSPQQKKLWYLNAQILMQNAQIILPPSLQKKLLTLTKQIPRYTSNHKRPKTIPQYNPVNNPGYTPSQPGTNKNRIQFIILDAGHGGKDPGNVHNGLLEKNVALRLTLLVQQLLKRLHPNIHVFLTRNGDNFVSLEERTIKAINLARLDHQGIFVSIHANASLNPNTKGIETFYFASNVNYESQERQLRVKKLIRPITNQSQAQNIITKMYDIQLSKESRFLAKLVNFNLYKQVSKYTLNRGVKTGKPYYVITHNNLPSILVEVGFLSHKSEAARLTNSFYQRKVVRGIVNGLSAFVNRFNQSRGFIK